MDFEGTVLIVSHDRSFLENMSPRTIEFRDHQLIEHLGDINYVLEKRKVEDLRTFTLAAEENQSKKKEAKTSTLNYEEKKKLKRKINYVERDIAKIEDKIKALQTEMSDPKFFMQPDSDEKMKQLSTLEKDLESKMEEWEEFTLKMEE